MLQGGSMEVVSGNVVVDDAVDDDGDVGISLVGFAVLSA